MNVSGREGKEINERQSDAKERRKMKEKQLVNRKEKKE